MEPSLREQKMRDHNRKCREIMTNACKETIEALTKHLENARGDEAAYLSLRLEQLQISLGELLDQSIPDHLAIINYVRYKQHIEKLQKAVSHTPTQAVIAEDPRSGERLLAIATQMLILAGYQPGNIINRLRQQLHHAETSSAAQQGCPIGTNSSTLDNKTKIAAIHWARQVQGISGGALAKKAKVSHAAISRLNKSSQVLSEEWLIKIMDILQLDHDSWPPLFKKGAFVKLQLPFNTLNQCTDFTTLLTILDLYRKDCTCAHVVYANNNELSSQIERYQNYTLPEIPTSYVIISTRNRSLTCYITGHKGRMPIKNTDRLMEILNAKADHVICLLEQEMPFANADKETVEALLQRNAPKQHAGQDAQKAKR